MSTSPHHIIAIGASAGGLEEINIFFDHTPLDAVSYVIVQHLSPDFKSRMVELLARHSKLEVIEASDGLAVASNKVYMIPNDKFMTVRGHRLFLTDKNLVKGPHLTINTFFNSLADDLGKKSIAVILSGLGSDGCEGIMSIKNAGGMVIARNPLTSEFASMPANAIKTGMVDFILEPSEMPDVIEGYVKEGAARLAQEEDDEKTFTSITELIKEQLPLDFSDYKHATILRRIRRRAEFNNCPDLDSYLNFLNENREELEILSKDFLISVTAFFRDAEAFHYLETAVIPEIIRRARPDAELKMWVAGCATGEEAYSLAMLISEQMTPVLKNTIVKIFATDIDVDALAFAGAGTYSTETVKLISPERLEHFFNKEGSQYKVKPFLRKMVIFAQHDLVKNPPYCNMEFISCRNLLIYMTPALQKKIYQMLLFGLKLEGYLFLGSSENPTPIIKNLEVLHKRWKVYRNTETKRAARFDAFSLPDILDFKKVKADFPIAQIPQNNESLEGEINANLVNKMDALLLCIDTDNQVIKTYGDTSRFLLQKNFNLNLVDLLPRPLGIAFNAIKSISHKTGNRETVSGITLESPTGNILVSLAIEHMNIFKGGAHMWMVTISEDKTAADPILHAKVFDERSFFDEYTLNIEEELKQVKEKLHAAYIKLDTSNENMQSFNEELISTNEEMQSTNEEMQSVNEELHTINADYQLKNKELLQTNDDLNNYFRSNVNGQLFVDKDMLLMQFSPGTVKQINLLPSDIGRPLSNITTNIKMETIIDDIKSVLANGSLISKEIETSNGRWYQMMTMPYTQSDNSPSGAIVTFNDITELKEAQLELDKRNISLLKINEDLDNFVHTTSHDLVAPLANIEMSIEVMNALKVADPELQKFLTIINTSIKKFRSLITDIATVAKVETGLLTTETVKLEELLNDIEWSLEDKIKSAGVVIKRDFKVPELTFSRKNLRSVLFNLLSNSIKFRSGRSPEIVVSTSKSADKILLIVQDNGIGIANDQTDKIFELYGRVDDQIDGHGIGLYLAKKIIESAGGEITVTSKVDEGSKFTVSVPESREVPILTPVLN